MIQQCHRCLSASRVIGASKAGRIRECAQGHRWVTRLVEVRETEETEPATAETVWSMTQRGMSVRQIAQALLMSPTTVVAHRRAAPTLQGVWK